MASKKTYVWIVVLVLVIAAAVVWLKKPHSPKQPAPAKQTQDQVTTVPKATGVQQVIVDNSKLPDRFPKDIPIETGATVTQNYNAVNASGKFQASREFVSAKTAAENFALYQASLKSSGWTVVQAINDTSRSQMIILASKGDNALNIRIYTDKGSVKVSINNETTP